MGEKVTYNRFSDDDQVNGQVDASGRYDVATGSELSGMLQYYSRHEDRSSPDEAGGKTPTPTTGKIGRVGAKQELGHLVLNGDVTAQRLQYGDVEGASGSTLYNGGRDRLELEGRARAAYELFPGYSAVGQYSANERNYDDATDKSGYNRSSKGWRAETGIGVDISQLLRGDFLVGYMKQDYEDDRLKDPSGLSVRGSFNWTPDKLTIIVPALERNVLETTRSGSSSMVQTLGSLLIRHELQRNILLSAYGSAARTTNTGTDTSDWQYVGRLRGTYAFTPEVYTGVELTQKVKHVHNDEGGYVQSTVMARLGLQF